MYNIAHKNMLGRHLMRMYKILPLDFNYFPQTYIMPFDHKEFLDEAKA